MNQPCLFPLLRRLLTPAGLVALMAGLSACDLFFRPVPCSNAVLRVDSPAVTGLSSTRAVLGATVTIAQGTTVSFRGVLFCRTEISADPVEQSANVLQVAASDFSPGVFTVAVENLEPGTSYTFKGIAHGDDGAGNHAGCGTSPVTFTTLPASGPADAAFAAPEAEGLFAAPYLNCLAAQPDGRTLIGGDFRSVEGVLSRHLARLHADGSVDSGFQAALTHAVKVLAVQADGRILFATEAGGGRLLANGSADGGFLASLDSTNVVRCFLPLPDGRILLGGRLENPETFAAEHVALLKADGSRESAAAFAPVVVSLGGTTAAGVVNCIALQTDGKLLIAGSFDTVNGQPRNHLARLNADGSLESTATFNIGAGANGLIRQVAAQADGKLVVWGAFTTFSGSGRVNFARLNANGSLDGAFVPPAVARGPMSAALQADGKLILGGGTNSTERLTATGALDATFAGAPTIQQYRLAPQIAALTDDGRVLLGGSGTGTPPGATLLRLTNPGGTQTLGATHPTRVQWLRSGPLPEVSQVTFEQSLDSGATWTPLGNGRPIAAGGGWELTGLNLTANGLLRACGRTVTTGGIFGSDPVFSSGIVEQVADLAALAPPVVGAATVTGTSSQSVSVSSTITFGGSSAITERGFVFAFTGANPGPVIGAPHVTKFTAPGTGTGIFNFTANGLIAGGRYTFRAFATNAHGTAYSPPVAAETTNKPTVQSPTNVNITATSAVLGGRITSDGGNPVYERGIVYASTPDRLMSGTGITKVVVSGSANPFSATINGLQPATSYAFAAYALNIAGISYSPVATFATTGGTPLQAQETAQALAVQPDGRTIVGGFFVFLGGQVRSSLARLNADGSVDAEFAPTTDGMVYAAAVQADGKIVIAGAFNAVNNESYANIARLHADGTLDGSFYRGVGASLPVSCLAIQPDGKILLGGAFTSVHNFGRNRLARLNADGTVDTSFNIGTGADDSVFTIALQDDGGILLGGAFQNVNGAPRPRLARLGSDGALESTTTFNTGTGPNARVNCIAVQPDGKILAGGDFTSVNGTALHRLARLHSDGRVESAATFDPGSGADGKVFSIALQADGRFLLGGAFQNVNGTPRARFAKLNANGSLDAALPAAPGADAGVDGIALFSDGAIQLGGSFANVNGSAASLTARVANPAAGSQSLTFHAGTAQWLRSGGAPEVSGVVFEHSTDGVNWTASATTARIAGGWEAAGITPPGGNWQLRARGRTTGGFLNSSSGVSVSLLRFGTDSDNDGLLDAWEITHFGTTAGHAAMDDHDGDGCVELLELAFGGNPLVPDNCQPAIVAEGGYLTVTITKQPGVIYTVESAAAPEGPWAAAGTTILTNDATTLKVRDNFTTGSAPHRFVRVRVTTAR